MRSYRGQAWIAAALLALAGTEAGGAEPRRAGMNIQVRVVDTCAAHVNGRSGAHALSVEARPRSSGAAPGDSDSALAPPPVAGWDPSPEDELRYLTLTY